MFQTTNYNESFLIVIWTVLDPQTKYSYSICSHFPLQCFSGYGVVTGAWKGRFFRVHNLNFDLNLLQTSFIISFMFDDVSYLLYPQAYDPYWTQKLTQLCLMFQL